MKGFYTSQAIDKPKKKKKNLKRIGGCESCKKYTECENGQQKVVGSGSNGILIVDGMTTLTEETTGIPLSAISQKYLRAKLDEVGVDLDECYYVHAIRCYIPTDGKKTPTGAINGCKELLRADIARLNPEKIFLMGENAIELIYNDRAQTSRIGGGNAMRYYGHSIPDQELNTWVFPLFAPEYPMQALSRRRKTLKQYGKFREEKVYLWEHSKLKTDDNFRIRNLYFKKHLKNAVRHDKPFTKFNYEEFCVSIETVEEAIDIVRSMHNESTITMDFETNMIKAYHPDADLITMSLAGENVSYGFDYYKNNPEFVQAVQELMLDESVKKIIAHLPMELSWTRHIIGCDIKGVVWDTVLASHFLAPTVNSGNSLKFNTLITDGILGYDSEVDEYMVSPTRSVIKRGKTKKEKPSVYAKNRMREFARRKRNMYCAADSLFTRRVFNRQYPLIRHDKKMYPLFKLYLAGLRVFTKASERGFVVKTDVLLRNLDECDREIIKYEAEIERCPELVEWFKNRRYEFNPNSSAHIRDLLFDLLGYDTEKRTDKGLKSTDADVLETLSINSKIAGLLLKHAKYIQIESFLEGIKRNTVEGVVHPDIGLSNASTGRSSSQNPNFQNLPVKDEIAMTMIKSCLTVPEGYEIYAPDYSNLEVRGGYSIHGDKTLRAELEDDSIDPHSLMASRIFGEDLDAVTLEIAKLKHPEKNNFTKDELKKIFKDDIRNYAKSPNFLLAYGGSANRLYKTLWDETFKEFHKEFFRRRGMATFDKFKAHCQGMYDFYWERYKQLYEWRQNTWESYLTNGYIYSPEGFKINGIVTKNLICNAPIQGSSFAVALRGLVKLDEVIEEEGWDSYIILQIHDSDEIAVKPSEFFNGLKEVIDECTVDYVNENTPWLQIDMEMDGEYFLGDWGTECSEDEWREKYQIPA